MVTAPRAATLAPPWLLSLTHRRVLRACPAVLGPRLTSKSVPSGPHLQWLAAVEYRHLVSTVETVRGPAAFAPGQPLARHTPLPPATWAQLELRLLMEALFGRELRTTTPDSYVGKVCRVCRRPRPWSDALTGRGHVSCAWSACALVRVQVVRQAVVEIQQYHQHLLSESATVSSSSSAAHPPPSTTEHEAEDGAWQPSASLRRRPDLSDETLRKVADAMRRLPLLCKASRQAAAPAGSRKTYVCVASTVWPVRHGRDQPMRWCVVCRFTGRRSCGRSSLCSDCMCSSSASIWWRTATTMPFRFCTS